MTRPRALPRMDLQVLRAAPTHPGRDPAEPELATAASPNFCGFCLVPGFGSGVHAVDVGVDMEVEAVVVMLRQGGGGEPL